MKRRLLALGAVLLAAVAPAAAQEQAKLLLTGSSTVAPLARELARSFTAIRPGAVITVESGGSGRGIADARAGRADIGMVSRALHADEKDLFAISIARDGVAFVVRRDNPVRAISREQVIGIYLGRVTNWKELGGADRPIRALTRPPGRSSVEVVAEYCGLKPEEMRAAGAVGENDELLRALLADAGTFAFLSFGFALDSAERGSALRLLTVDGVPPTPAELRSGRYPIGRTLTLVTRTVPAGLALEFIRHAQSPQARAAIEAHDFVPYLPVGGPGR